VDRKLGVEFRSVIDNPAAKNQCMLSLMLSSTTGPVRLAMPVEVGLVIAFEGVLDTASAGDWNFSKPWFMMWSHLRFTVYVQGEQLTLGKERKLTRTLQPLLVNSQLQL